MSDSESASSGDSFHERQCRGSSNDRESYQSNLRELPAPLPGHKFFLEFFSGALHPVTTAVASLRCQCLQPLDTSLGDRIHDLLDSDTFHALTKLVTSGLLAFMWVAPPCLPDQESFSILQGTLSLMELAFLSGAHVAFAQPSNAISWQQPLLHEWLHRIPHHMISVAQCQYVPLGQATVQSWQVATTCSLLLETQSQCLHHEMHPPIQVQRHPRSGSVSFPEHLCLEIALALRPLFAQHEEGPVLTPWGVAMQELPLRLPSKASDKKFMVADGGGVDSTGDWTVPHAPDYLADLRRAWLLYGLRNKILPRISISRPSNF